MTLTLKHDKGWFAAGAEVENALKVLTDGAFKLFIHLCLAAPRQTGVLETSQSELARTLHKTNGTIRKYLQEMEEQGLCRLSGFVPVPYCRGRIEITDEFWPYHRHSTPEQNQTIGDESLDQVRRLLEARSCVAASFSTADEILARKWLEDGAHPFSALLRAGSRGDRPDGDLPRLLEVRPLPHAAHGAALGGNPQTPTNVGGGKLNPLETRKTADRRTGSIFD
ncbi:MAG: winged helix-turn-helix domain-containing protein [Acidobacteriota bacterium]